MATDTVSLSTDILNARRESMADSSHQQVMFAVRSLYGLSSNSVKLPTGKNESIESGQVALMIDPDAGPQDNIGVVDYDAGKIKVRYGCQAVFPGLYTLVTEERFDPSLLSPVRVTATDECTMTPEMDGFHAQGCLDFLPGSIWSGATGG